MSDTEPQNNLSKTEVGLPPLPFTYRQTLDPDKAQIREFGYDFAVGNEDEKILSLEKVLEKVKTKKEN